MGRGGAGKQFGEVAEGILALDGEDFQMAQFVAYFSQCYWTVLGALPSTSLVTQIVQTPNLVSYNQFQLQKI